MSLSDANAWLGGLGDKLVAGVSAGSRIEFEARLADLQAQAQGLGPELQAAAQNRFVSACLGRGLGAALPADPLQAGAYLPGVQDAVGAAQAALQKPLAVLGEIQAAADQLRQAASAAWSAARTASAAVRTCEKAEIAAAKIAMATGLPPVTAAWALATQIRGVALDASELAAKAGRAADQAWGSVVRVVDRMRASVFDQVDALERIADDTIGALTAGIEGAAEAAHADLFADLEQAVQSVTI